jgi:DNA replication protein DnaC
MSTVEVDQTKTKLKLFEYHNYEGLGPEDFEHYMENPNNYRISCFTFDRIYDDESTQEEVYTETARLSVCSALEGYNATIMAYGQTGTGKTFTMEGFRYNMLDEQRGIIPRAVEDIFKYIQSCDDEQVHEFAISDHFYGQGIISTNL